jgi:tetratricopeptide (TPR) repeat protein
MDRHTLKALLTGALIVSLWAGICCAVTPSETLEQARSLVAGNRYAEALALLEPLVGDDLSEETSWEIAAETGRAAFHLGQYRKAHLLFKRVVQARPIVMEPALYLEATSYLLGDQRQAFGIFEAILQSGAQDLYLAVTLPGEKQFLGEPKIQELLERHAQPLVVRPTSATIQGVQLGQKRSMIADNLSIDAPSGESTLAARAGPFLTWVYSFDSNDQLHEVVLNAEHLRRYTPFTLDLSDGISWTSTPITCIDSLGGKHRSSTTTDGALILTWDFSEASLDLVFSRPDTMKNGAAILEMIRLYRRPS